MADTEMKWYVNKQFKYQNRTSPWRRRRFRGAYEIGVWQALREMGIPIDLVTGTSVGAINGALIAQRRF